MSEARNDPVLECLCGHWLVIGGRDCWFPRGERRLRSELPPEADERFWAPMLGSSKQRSEMIRALQLAGHL